MERPWRDPTSRGSLAGKAPQPTLTMRGGRVNAQDTSPKPQCTKLGCVKAQASYVWRVVIWGLFGYCDLGIGHSARAHPGARSKHTIMSARIILVSLIASAVRGALVCSENMINASSSAWAHF